MTEVYVNQIGTAVPPHDIHCSFIAFARSRLAGDARRGAVFSRMVERSGIDHRYSCLAPATSSASQSVDAGGLYRRERFPDTRERMRLFETYAPALAEQAVARSRRGIDGDITHLIVTSCTGFSAPGLDLELLDRCRLSQTVERTSIGFMGCYAALNTLKVARHIVRSEPKARVLAVNLELCTLHLQETDDLEQLLSFLIFADGCSAAVVSAEPNGLRLERFNSLMAADTAGLITWDIGPSGFDMVLSGRVPGAIHDALAAHTAEALCGAHVADIDLWAIHPGGRTVLDAVEKALKLEPDDLAISRRVLQQFGNMSSATVMFVLEAMMRDQRGKAGCAMAFGPGLVAESMIFRT